MAKPLNRFAIVDGANVEGLMAILADLDPPHSCLYLEPVQAELVAIAPYLIQLNEEVDTWLLTLESHWGIYLTSTENLQAMRKHLRKYLQVQLPDEEKPVFFRFYDPRNIWDLTEVLSDWELHNFLGPIDTIETLVEQQQRSDNFLARRKAYPRDSSSKAKMLRLDNAHMEKFNAIYEARYIKKLNTLFPSLLSKRENLTGDLFQYIKANEITDDRSIRGLFSLFVERDFSDIDTFRKAFSLVIEDHSDPGHYRAETLLIRELGHVPV